MFTVDWPGVADTCTRCRRVRAVLSADYTRPMPRNMPATPAVEPYYELACFCSRSKISTQYRRPLRTRSSKQFSLDSKSRCPLDRSSAGSRPSPSLCTCSLRIRTPQTRAGANARNRSMSTPTWALAQGADGTLDVLPPRPHTHGLSTCTDVGPTETDHGLLIWGVANIARIRTSWRRDFASSWCMRMAGMAAHETGCLRDVDGGVHVQYPCVPRPLHAKDGRSS